MTMYDNSVPIVNLPFLYINGGILYNYSDATNKKFSVDSCICRDSTDTYDLNLGNYNGQSNYGTPNSATLCDATKRGINALDTGSLVASTVYYVYIVADVVSANVTGVMLSANLPTVGPIMPFGYNAFRLIGYMMADSSAELRKFFQYGSNNSRYYEFENLVTVLTNGTSTGYSGINLYAYLPKDNDKRAEFCVNFNANAANDSVIVKSGLTSNNDPTNYAPVAGSVAHLLFYPTIGAPVVGGVPFIQYLVSAGSVTISITGFSYTI